MQPHALYLCVTAFTFAMQKEKIPVYDICSLAGSSFQQQDFLAERFGNYLQRHSPQLHHAHRHSFYHLVLFTEGAGSHTIDFTRFKVKPFDIYFMVPGQVHSWSFEGRTDGFIINFSESFFRSFLLNPNYLDRFSFFSGNSQDCICHLPVNSRRKVTQLFEDIVAQVQEHPYDADIIKLILLQIFMVTGAACPQHRCKSVPQQKLVLLKNFRKLIDQHFLHLKLPKQYADLLYVTPNHLNALTQDLLGKTAGELIRDRVLLEAKRLLTNATMSITEIAFGLNFQDNSYFNRFFKKAEGVTPDEFRKQFILPNQQQRVSRSHK